MITKDNAAQYIPLLQAVAEGKTLQAKSDAGNWVTLKGLYLLDEPDAYRVKPEPLELRLWVRGEGEFSYELGGRWAAYMAADGWRLATFREVVEEVIK